MLQMLHDAQALVVGPLQLALQVYSHKLVGCALPLPHKQGSQLNRKELSQVLSSLERGALLELRSFLLQVRTGIGGNHSLAASCTRMPTYMPEQSLRHLPQVSSLARLQTQHWGTLCWQHCVRCADLRHLWPFPRAYPPHLCVLRRCCLSTLPGCPSTWTSCRMSSTSAGSGATCPWCPAARSLWWHQTSTSRSVWSTACLCPAMSPQPLLSQLSQSRVDIHSHCASC